MDKKVQFLTVPRTLEEEVDIVYGDITIRTTVTKLSEYLVHILNGSHPETIEKYIGELFP